jgi:insulin-like growth factor 2 receptor
MSPLANKSFNLTLDGENYFFSVCSPTLEPCAGKAAACLTTANKQSTSLGVQNDYLRYNVTGSPYILYENGAKCDDTRHWSTKIEFLCASEGLAEGPHIIEHKDCQLLIHFVTEYACQTNMTCKVESYSDNVDGMVIDLTRLIRTNENYVATVNETVSEQKGWDKSVQVGRLRRK